MNLSCCSMQAFCSEEGIGDGKIVCLGLLGVWLAGLLGHVAVRRAWGLLGL